MRTSLLPIALFLAVPSFAQGVFCDDQGKVALFSNYDGGALTINVDQPIAGLRIGIVSYEFAVISITGPYASMVADVQWAGYNGNNDHCGTGAITQSTVIGGVTSGASEVVVIPPATLTNPNGNPNIICAYSCDIGNEQGGCNTVDQIVDYFMDQWAGSLYFHRTQYGCWNTTWNISDGGNCCLGWMSTGSEEPDGTPHWSLYPVPASHGLFTGHAGPFEIYDAQGRTVMRTSTIASSIDVSHLSAGAYRIRSLADGSVRSFVIER